VLLHTQEHHAVDEMNALGSAQGSLKACAAGAVLRWGHSACMARFNSGGRPV
jgi:hypothetical protein